MYRFTKVASGERKRKVHITNHTSRQNTQCCEVVKLTYQLSISECTSTTKYEVEKENNKFHIIVHTPCQNDKRYEK